MTVVDHFRTHRLPAALRSGATLRRALRWVLVVAVVCGAAVRGVTAHSNREHTLKAGFLINFSQFTTWPRTAFGSPQSPFVIGIIGPDPFGPTLEAVVDGVDVGGRRIEIRRLATGDEVRRCHILFVGTMNARELKRMVDLVGSAPVLTVGDGDGFLEAGGVVAFRIENNRVRFDVNAVAARRVGLTLSSEMLQYARVVTP